jgi:hypothetical protein
LSPINFISKFSQTCFPQFASEHINVGFFWQIKGSELLEGNRRRILVKNAQSFQMNQMRKNIFIFKLKAVNEFDESHSRIKSQKIAFNFSERNSDFFQAT